MGLGMCVYSLQCCRPQNYSVEVPLTDSNNFLFRKFFITIFLIFSIDFFILLKSTLGFGDFFYVDLVKSRVLGCRVLGFVLNLIF